jgi:hypothetical protein
VGFRDNTYLPLLEAQWSIGCVEVGYSASFADAPNAERPELKEQKDTKVNKKAPDSILGLNDLDDEIESLKSRITEKFYVKHIPAHQLLCSASDFPLVEKNDWMGYWEDVALSDVKATKAYDNTDTLKASVPGDEKRAEDVKEAEAKMGEPEKVRLYKLWNLRTKERLVIAENHEKYLLQEAFKRFPLKYLRFDVDPKHFFPRPPILNKLNVQDDYNRGREFVRLTMKGRVPRFTVDRNLIASDDMKKLESGEHGMYVFQDGGNGVSAIMPVQQPNLSDSAIQSLTLSDKEFEDVGGVGGDARTSQEATATQAKIAAVKSQVADSFDRGIVADWLASICDELLRLAIDNMNVDQIVAMNVAPDSLYSQQIAMDVAQTFKKINAETLGRAETGMTWSVQIDVESLSPVSEEEAFQKWMQGLTLIGNPQMARLFSVSPDLLKMTLEKMGIRSARDQEMIITGLQKMVQQEMEVMRQQAMAGGSAPKQPGVSPMGGSPKPGTPNPQPGGPQGPGASGPQ